MHQHFQIFHSLFISRIVTFSIVIVVVVRLPHFVQRLQFTRAQLPELILYDVIFFSSSSSCSISFCCAALSHLEARKWGGGLTFLFFYCFIKIISSSASTCNYTTKNIYPASAQHSAKWNEKSFVCTQQQHSIVEEESEKLNEKKKKRAKGKWLNRLFSTARLLLLLLCYRGPLTTFFGPCQPIKQSLYFH